MKSTESFENLAELLRESGEYVTTVCGVSMWPMLRYKQDAILIHPLSGELKRFDVAVYKRDEKYVVHRVLSVQENFYIIRGDNCLAKEVVPKQNVVGVVTGFWRFGRFIDVSNIFYRVYARVWVSANPLINLTSFAKSKARAAWRKITVI